MNHCKALNQTQIKDSNNSGGALNLDELFLELSTTLVFATFPNNFSFYRKANRYLSRVDYHKCL